MSALGAAADSQAREIERLTKRLDAAEEALHVVGDYLRTRTLGDLDRAVQAVMAWRRIPKLRR